ncbi:unnamed protein product [Plutella xylostella]|uniref:(diamondback moth) hypothetical protein n=1 Tax=Plutella xylostella TaxID=51655 RepID=A0A8S4FYI9_PLUXY|nr:unnamed protein product [Plutella xylostella]
MNKKIQSDPWMFVYRKLREQEILGSGKCCCSREKEVEATGRCRCKKPVSLRAWAAQAPAWRLPPRGGESSRLPQAEDDTRACYLFLFRTSL